MNAIKVIITTTVVEKKMETWPLLFAKNLNVVKQLFIYKISGQVRCVTMYSAILSVFLAIFQYKSWKFCQIIWYEDCDNNRQLQGADL
jgi:hypothetical protein